MEENFFSAWGSHKYLVISFKYFRWHAIGLNASRVTEYHDIPAKTGEYLTYIPQWYSIIFKVSH